MVIHNTTARISAVMQGQQLSWFRKQGQERDARLIAQIFFPTSKSNLDAQDKQVLERLNSYFWKLMTGSYSRVVQPIELRFLGYADHRGSTQNNDSLSRGRAMAVASFVSNSLVRSPLYSGNVEARGEVSESSTDGQCTDLSFHRRVDVYTKHLIRPPRLEITTVVKGTPPPDVSNRFGVKILGSGSIGRVVVAGQSLELEIRNPRSGEVAKYIYVGGGAGAGAPLSVGLGSDEFELELPYWFSLDDFEGTGQVITGGVGANVTALFFNGPMNKNLCYEPVGLDITGFDITAGVQFDVIGYWHLDSIRKGG